MNWPEDADDVNEGRSLLGSGSKPPLTTLPRLELAFGKVDDSTGAVDESAGGFDKPDPD